MIGAQKATGVCVSDETKVVEFRISRLVVVAAAVLFSATPLMATDQLRTVALSGDTSFGGTLTSFDSVSLNDRGETIFSATFDNDQDTSGLFVEAAVGDLALLARTGDPAPGTDVEFNWFSRFTPDGPMLSSSGASAVLAGFTGPGVNNTNRRGIFSSVGGQGLELVARSGAPAPIPRTPANFGDIVTSLVQNEAGHTAFMATLSGAGVGIANDFAIFSEGAGNGLRLVAREGNVAPVGVSGVAYSFPAVARNLWSISLNDQGHTAFVGFLTGSGVEPSNSMAIFKETVGGMAMVIRTNSAAPGMAAGVNIRAVDIPLLNNQGRTAFVAELTGAGVTEANDFAFFREAATGGLEVVVRDGDTAPGTNAGLLFDFNYQGFSRAFNGNGQVAMIARLKEPSGISTNDRGVFSDSGGSGLRMIAQYGGAVPGVPNDAVFGGFSYLALNERGQTAFLAFVEDAAGTSLGLFAEDVLGNLKLIARTGDMLDVSDNPAEVDLRRVLRLDFIGSHGNETGRASGFNQRGQLAFRAEFADGSSGTFVSNLVAIPEPSNMALSLLGIGALIRRRERR